VWNLVSEVETDSKYVRKVAEVKIRIEEGGSSRSYKNT
jgi:hypothetical protein